MVMTDSGVASLEDLEGGNGVFLRIRTPVELEMLDEFVVGDQLLRIQKNPIPDDGPDPDPTYFYSSPKWPSSFRVTQVFEGGADGCSVVARGNTLQIGSAVGDLVFPDSEFHRRELTIRASRNATRADFEHVMAAIRSGAVPTAKLATHSTKLENVPRDMPGWAHDRTGLIKAIITV